VKVRQPLARALVSVPVSERAGLAPLTDDVAEELNVKAVELSDGTGDLVERAQAELPRARSGVPAARAAGRSGDQRAGRDAAAALARRLARGPTALTVDDDTVTITPEMVEVVETPRTGWAVAREGAPPSRSTPP
jgi:isoleucyl-tRNA synthetase